MKLYEFEAKSILNRCGVPVPRGEVVTNPDQVAGIAETLTGPVFLKAQVTVSGRGKAGGILEARDASQAAKVASGLFGTVIKGLIVKMLLVEEKLDVKDQFYTSIALDRRTRAFVALASRHGGADIEDVARTSPLSINRVQIDPLTGLTETQIRGLAQQMDLAPALAAQFALILAAMYRAAVENDAELVEINPLVETQSGDLVAADARLIIDDNALFRHPEYLQKNLEREEDTPREAEARRLGLNYVDLDGDIGIMGNGAGLMMASLDTVHHFGGRPANFLDIGGGAQAEVIKNGLLLILDKPEVKAVLINILGGITRCDIVADGVVQGLRDAQLKKPVLVRMMGTNEKEGQELLRRHGVEFFPDMEQAARAAVAAAR
jgi:succinyl-CoA synthetase beta subunit